MNIAQKIIEAHKLKFGSLPPFCQTRVSGSTFVNADCFDVFPFIEDKSIDAIICDLPYGTTANKWDSVLPLDKLWKQYERIIADNGSILLFGGQPFTSALIMSNLKMYKCVWYWKKEKGVGFTFAKFMPMRQIEVNRQLISSCSVMPCKMSVTIWT